VPAFHVRSIPPELYERLRARAREQGRSVNAEVLRILEGELSRPRDEDFMRRLDRLRAQWTLSPDAPRPEDLIREDRDSR
jgi:plasmid stability protein